MTETATKQGNTTETEVKREVVLKYECDENRISIMKKGTLALVVLMTISYLWTGSYSCKSISDIAVFASWALYLLPLLLAWFSVLPVMRLGKIVTLKQHKGGPARACQGGAFAALLSAATILCCIYFLATGEYDSFAVEVGMLIRALIQFLAALALTLLSRYSLLQLKETLIPIENENEQAL